MPRRPPGSATLRLQWLERFSAGNTVHVRSSALIRGSSSATLTMPTYINYYVIVDVSQSMGVASTAADMQNVYNRVVQYGNYDSAADKTAKIGCVFGCHVQQTDSSGYTQPISNETLAHSALYGSYITLRIDAAKSAIQSVLSLAEAANQKSGLNLIQVGVYTMQQNPQVSPNTYLTTVSAPSSNLSNIQPPNPAYVGTDPNSVSYKTNTIDLGPNNGGGTGDTNLLTSLEYFNSNILTSKGDGSTASSPLNYVFVVTDGIKDTPGGCTDGHCTGVIDYVNACQPIQQKATVGVIYTTYLPVYQQNNPSFKSSDPKSPYVDTYYDLVLPYANQIAPALQNCATSAQWYYEAVDGPAITASMQNLFLPSIQAARIAQ